MAISILKEYAVRIVGREGKRIIYIYSQCTLVQELRYAVNIKPTGLQGLGADHNPTWDGVEKKAQS